MSNGFQPFLPEPTQNRMLEEMRRQLLTPQPPQPPPSLVFTPRTSHPLTTLTPNPNLEQVINFITRSAATSSPSFNRGLGVHYESRIHKPMLKTRHSNPDLRQNTGGCNPRAGMAAVARFQAQIAMREQQHRDQNAAHQINFSTAVPSTFSSSQPNATLGRGHLDAFGNLVVPSIAKKGVPIHDIEDDGVDHGLDLSLRL